MILDLIVGSLGLGLSVGFAQWWGGQLALADPAPAPIEVVTPSWVDTGRARVVAERVAEQQEVKLQPHGLVAFRDEFTPEQQRELERSGQVDVPPGTLRRTWSFPVVDDRPGWISWASGWALLMALAPLSGTILLLGAGLLP